MTDSSPASLLNAHPLVSMRFRPAWTYIDGIREFGEFFCRTTFEDPEIADRACIIIQETLENAVKYSSGDSSNELELVIKATSSLIEFSVISTPNREHLDALQLELRQLNDMDPEAAFMAALQRAEREPNASARLGLARMRYEAAVELLLEDTQDGRIRFTARGKL